MPSLPSPEVTPAPDASITERLRQLAQEQELDAGPAKRRRRESDAGVSRVCRPVNVSDFRRRVASFRAPWWFNRPVGLSPIACAGRGWSNSGPDIAECECCGATLQTYSAADETGVCGKEAKEWLVNGQPVPVQSVASRRPWPVVSEAHSIFCPWRSCIAAPAEPDRYSDKELAEAVKRRAEGLRGVRHLPALPEGVQGQVDVATALARAGWEPISAGSTEGAKGEKQADKLARNIKAHAQPHNLGDLLCCSICLRTVAVRSFSHFEVGTSSRPSALRPPDKDLWTPRPRGGLSTVSAGQALFDPYALHRFYCPLYSRGDEELQPLAVRIIRASAAAAAADAGAAAVSSTGSTSLSCGDTIPTAKPNGPSIAEAAVARAEELLQALDALLPPP